MLRKPALILLAAATLALPFAARAQSQDQLVDKFSGFAGSESNSKSLVTGLRDGKEVTLTSGQAKTTFTPPTRKLGNGEVNIALSLAEADLKKQGVTHPTSDQLKAELDKILKQRASGQGWGQIANAMGFKLGDVVRSERSRGRDVAARDEHRNDKPERGEKQERPDRPEHPNRADRGR
jgi:hypothetical protein